jgi:hypothetical protein
MRANERWRSHLRRFSSKGVSFGDPTKVRELRLSPGDEQWWPNTLEAFLQPERQPQQMNAICVVVFTFDHVLAYSERTWKYRMALAVTGTPWLRKSAINRLKSRGQ